MNYYERHLGDYAKDAGHLSMLEHGAYTLLLDRYYTTEQPIPADQAHRVCRARTKEERAAVDAVLAEFFALDGAVYRNGRADREITKMQAKVKAAQENGKRGGRPKQTEQKPTGFPLGSELVTQRKAHQSPVTSNQETPPNPRKRGQVSARFDEFWLAWPKNERKQDKAKCAEHWRRHDLDAEADAVLADVRVKRGTEKWRDGFIEAPLVYLRGKRWQDGVTPNDGPAEAALDWRATWKTIVAKGIELGCGEWSEELQMAGKAPDFPAYRARVERKVRELEAPPDEAGQQRIAGLMGGLKVVG